MNNSRLIILCYHGVIDDVPHGYNSSGKHIDVNEFTKQISYLSSKFEVVTMMDVEKYARGGGSLPSNCVAITFDDGFLNNLKIAHPVLERFGVPATLYVSTNFISNSSLIWTDELERMILESPTDTPNFSCSLTGAIVDFSSTESKVRSLKSLKRVLKRLIPKQRNAALQQFSQHIHSDYAKSRIPLLHDFLDWDQIRWMSKTGIWEIGAHTLSHNSLGTLSEADGKSEIMCSMSKVRHELGLSHPPLFSYPEGQELDMPSYAVKTLKDSGLHSAPSAIPGFNDMTLSSSESFFRLRRYMVGFEDLPFPWLL